ncbi:single-strand binding protein [Lentzea atacamensis]|uniref:Single-stranded DNA-binding protein n=1 Tax=Lentzea atacamensis TaxID=531938 RepID=A0A316HMY8_9PSEU|nr:single-stranded DNA-binding protein [Lentzea atacamensis]PWK81684.1 single-strand binding protein [Lentzea atacamensis]
MPGLPSVTVVGTLTADVELRYTSSGVAVASFTIAANDRKYDQASKSWKDGDATFLRCTLWRQAAENAAESLIRGTRVIATGALKQRSFETREGEKRTVLELDVDELGPSVKWATVKVQKADREGGTSPKASSEASQDDPWGSDAPPF